MRPPASPGLPRFAALTAFALLALSACAPRPGMVRIPRADRTPPAAELRIAPSSPTGEAEMRLAAEDEPETVRMRETDSLVLTAVAVDADGGIRESALQGHALVTCRDAATGKAIDRTTGFARRHVPGTSPSRTAPIRREERFVLRGSDFARLCPGGRLESAVGQADATAANFHGGGSASARLRFRVTLSDVAAHAIPVPGGRAAASALAASGTGFVPAAGLGGSGPEDALGPVPGGSLSDCMDPPVPFMSPRRADVSPVPAAAPAAPPRGRGSAQNPQIPRPRA